jgi:histone H2B
MSARSSKKGAQSAGPGRVAGRAYKKKRTETFNLYIFKVLKQVHPNIGMSKKAMGIMNSFTYDTFERIANEASNIVKYNKKATMDARAVQCACKLVLPGELSKHAETEANKAVNKYAAN